MSQHDNILSIQLIKKDGELVLRSAGERSIHDEFVKALEEGQVVNAFYEACKDDGTYLQLSKIHPCIRKLAEEVGYTFEEMKREVKKHAGLCYQIKDQEICKSFADCSVEELGLAIQAIIEIGDTVGVNFRGRLPEISQDQTP